MVRLKGGNDGLNTIIPVYDYDNYISKRPSIHINALGDGNRGKRITEEIVKYLDKD